MKLRNKKTGEIGHLRSTNWNETALIIMDNDGVQLAKYTFLTELNEEWEDYEEPKEYWFVSEFGKVYSLKNIPMDKERIDWLKLIGNYFSSREEAEKAVEKLKAVKRMKDKGFRFLGYYHRLGETKSKGEIGFEMVDYEDVKQDLDLLFSGGEE